MSGEIREQTRSTVVTECDGTWSRWRDDMWSRWLQNELVLDTVEFQNMPKISQDHMLKQAADVLQYFVILRNKAQVFEEFN